METQVTLETKVCTKCKRELPISAFNRNNKSKDGLQYYCKECMAECNNQYTKRYKSLVDQPSDVDSELSKYTPRQLMEELKRRGFKWEYMLEPQRKIYYDKI